MQGSGWLSDTEHCAAPASHPTTLHPCQQALLWLDSRLPQPKSPVKANEMFSAVSSELVKQMLDWFRDQDRKVYKTAIASLAAQRKLRPVFIERKSLPDQYAWIHKTLQLRGSAAIGEHLLQAWLMGGQQQLLAAFCDAMEIEHNGKGTVSGELPEALDSAKLDQAVDQLLQTHDPQLVTLYLTCFNQQIPGGWESLNTRLEGDERLKLG